MTLVAEGLGRLALFADLSPEALAELAAIAREQECGEGEWVLHEGDENAALHVILEGEAGLVVGGVERLALHAGMYFGEMSTLLGDRVAAGVYARARLRCAVVDRDPLFRFLLANPSVTLRLLQAEARRLADTNRWLA
ncbi:MAG TPA: cyclic nucleotide-binding domain-containing protein [Gaiellaceae bacterium]|nr:cyclic nucleotide-binding domain-containing protein [Gaiellaceae bacterium]